MITTWIVAFIARPRRFWWDWLYRGPWRHVVAYRYDPRSGWWLAVDWNQVDLQVCSFTRDEVAGLWVQHVDDGGVLVRWDGPQPGTGGFRGLAFCVPVVGHALGLRARPLTPRGLLSALRAAGGTDFLLDDTAPTQEQLHEQRVGRQGAENGPGSRAAAEGSG